MSITSHLLRIIRHGHLELVARVWQLRQQFTAYDATYLALAESLDATLVTCDRPLGAARGHSARVDVIRQEPGSRYARTRRPPIRTPPS